MITEQKTIRTNEEIFVQAYKIAFPKVASFVKKMGGNLEESRDIFQDALVIYYEKKVAPKLIEEHGDAQYICGIARHLWYKKFKEKKLQKPFSFLTEIKTEEQDPKVSEKILNFVEVSGKKCLELLKSFYYDKTNMKELAEKFGFSGERSATAQKFKCLEKVRNNVKQKALSKEDFYE